MQLDRLSRNTFCCDCGCPREMQREQYLQSYRDPKYDDQGNGAFPTGPPTEFSMSRAQSNWDYDHQATRDAGIRDMELHPDSHAEEIVAEGNIFVELMRASDSGRPNPSAVLNPHPVLNTGSTPTPGSGLLTESVVNGQTAISTGSDAVAIAAVAAAPDPNERADSTVAVQAHVQLHLVDDTEEDFPLSVFLPPPPAQLHVLPYDASSPSGSLYRGSMPASREGSFSTHHGLVSSQPNSFNIQTPHLPPPTRFSPSVRATHQLLSGSAHSMTGQQISQPHASPASSFTSNSMRSPPSLANHSFITHTLLPQHSQQSDPRMDRSSPRHRGAPANSFTSSPAGSFTATTIQHSQQQHMSLTPSSIAGSFTAATTQGFQAQATGLPTSILSSSFTAASQGPPQQRQVIASPSTSPRKSRQGLNATHQNSPLRMAGMPIGGSPTATPSHHGENAGVLVRQENSPAGSFSSQHMGVLSNSVGSFSDPMRQGPTARSHLCPLAQAEQPLPPATPEPSAPPLPSQNA